MGGRGTKCKRRIVANCASLCLCARCCHFFPRSFSHVGHLVLRSRESTARPGIVGRDPHPVSQRPADAGGPGVAEGMASWAPIRTISELASGTAASAPVAEPGMAGATGGQSPESTSEAVDIGACLNRAVGVVYAGIWPAVRRDVLDATAHCGRHFRSVERHPLRGRWAATRWSARRSRPGCFVSI